MAQTSPVPADLPDKKSTISRFDSIDILRGLVMIIMALDHTRDFFHISAWSDDPLNLQTTSPVLFLTRWITHFCAPVFVFLAGSSIWFQGTKKTKKELSLFLIKRGLWLILVEIVIFNFAFSFDPSYTTIALQVIWAIGGSMVILGLMIWLPFHIILLIGSAIVFGHNTLDLYEAKRSDFTLIYSLLHRPGVFPISEGHSIFAFYPILSWCGLMIMGYCFGKLFTFYKGAQRNRILTWLGLGIILFFIALRAANIYGNPRPWSHQNDFLFTIFSFVDTHKYPPSLLYMCMTIGPAILFIRWFGKIKNRITDIIMVFGRVPFFYYILHFFLIHFLCMLFFLMRGHTFKEGIHTGFSMLPNFIVNNEGYSLAAVYGIWIFVVVLLYPLCKWFSTYKKTHSQWWLSYL